MTYSCVNFIVLIINPISIPDAAVDASGDASDAAMPFFPPFHFTRLAQQTQRERQENLRLQGEKTISSQLKNPLSSGIPSHRQHPLTIHILDTEKGDAAENPRAQGLQSFQQHVSG